MSRHFYPRIFLSVAVFALAVFLLFYKLGDAPLRIWDESLFAMRAYHMAETGGIYPILTSFPGLLFTATSSRPLGHGFRRFPSGISDIPNGHSGFRWRYLPPC